MQCIEVLKPGVQTTVQDYPGRTGYWHVGVPPSGPMDNLAFKLGNQILGNEKSAAGLEITFAGPELKFHIETIIAITGALSRVTLNGVPMSQWCAIRVKVGSILKIESIIIGARAYLCFKKGLKIAPLFK